MAKKGRAVKVQGAAVVDSDYTGAVCVNVLRVPKVDAAGLWKLSAKGNRLFDTLCYPTTVAVAVTAKSATDPKVWRVNVGGKEMTPQDARVQAIGFSAVTDTTSGKRYLVSDAQDMDAIPDTVKKEIIAKSKRRSAIKRIELACKLIKSVDAMQGIANVFSDDEKNELFNTPARLLNSLKDTLHKVVKTQGVKPQFLSIA